MTFHDEYGFTTGYSEAPAWKATVRAEEAAARRPGYATPFKHEIHGTSRLTRVSPTHKAGLYLRVCYSFTCGALPLTTPMQCVAWVRS